MTRRSLVPVALLGAAMLVLAVAAVTGEEEPPTAAISHAALVFGFGLAVRQQRNEHEPEERLSRLQLVTEVFEGRTLAVLALLVFVFTFVALDATGPLAAALASMSIAVNALVSTRRILARQGIERDQFLMATSIAFGVTMAASGAWVMFDAFSDVPKLDVAAAWLFGMFALGVATIVLERRSA